ncbi:hypothetical protein [Diaphorobacter ruginosibacter]|uniref:hypothetical protein n=1 Tax=Diaphorobacter ruginosibacter TaxID=1715720 RepID=UPI003341C39E
MAAAIAHRPGDEYRKQAFSAHRNPCLKPTTPAALAANGADRFSFAADIVAISFFCNDI